MGIFVRKVERSDITTLIEYNQALAEETENISLAKHILQSGIEKTLGFKNCSYFVAELDGKIVGQTMITSEWSDWRNGMIWWMQSIYVHPNYRKQGVFRTVFKYIESVARKNPEVKAFRLYVMKNNQAARSTYQSLDMKNSGYVIYEKFF